MNLDTRAVRFLARMGARGTLGQVLYDYAREGNDFYVVSADLMRASGFDRLMKEYPDKAVNVGIAEQNLIGVSAGLAYTGIPVVATTWAMFASARVADQVRNFMGYMQKNVKLVGMDSGLALSRFGYSHTNPPDLAIMRAIPQITILSPCDGLETYKAICAAIQTDGPVYIRLTGTGFLPIVYKDPAFDYKIGKAINVREGEDAAIIATGTVVSQAIAAADLLATEGISVRVIDMHTIAPLDGKMLESLRKYRLIITVEEHLKHGGLGSAVAEYYARSCEHPKHVILGVDDFYPAAGRQEYVARCSGITSQQIADAVRNNL